MLAHRNVCKKKYTDIFFDLDNTLWDFKSNSFYALERMFKADRIFELYNITFDEFYLIYNQVNEKYWLQYRKGEISKAEFINKRFLDSFSQINIFDTKLSNGFRNRYLEEIVKTKNITCHGAMEILVYLSKRNYKIHVVTNGFYDVSKKKMKNSGIDKFIYSWVSSDEVGVRKPDPIIFEEALLRANAKKENSLMIGDDFDADIKGALNFGIDSVYLAKEKILDK